MQGSAVDSAITVGREETIRTVQTFTRDAGTFPAWLRTHFPGSTRSLMRFNGLGRVPELKTAASALASASVKLP